MQEDLVQIRITKETRDKIADLAEKMGYKQITTLEYLLSGKIDFYGNIQTKPTTRKTRVPPGEISAQEHIRLTKEILGEDITMARKSTRSL